MNGKNQLMIPQDSPKIHLVGVNLGNREKSVKTKKTTTQSSCFSLSPPPPRAMPARAFSRVYARGWVKG